MTLLRLSCSGRSGLRLSGLCLSFISLGCLSAGCDPGSPEPDAAVVDAPGADVPASDAAQDTPAVDASMPDAPVATDTRPSAGCAGSTTLAAGATTELTLSHDGLERSFRVHLPPGYDGSAPLPLVLMFHGGGGSGRQLEERSANMNPIADREGFVAVYPDGTGAVLRTWNGGGCCGSAVTNDVDDVGFVGAMLDRLEAELCVDRSRFYASGMSNGGIMSHRLACEIPERFAAVAPVAGAEMAPACEPDTSVALMHIHGTLDGHVPPPGGFGCGPAGVPFPPLDETMESRRVANGCDATTEEAFVEGDGTCTRYTGCEADTLRCMIEGGGHNWPGGQPPAGVAECPEDGGQSTTFVASEVIWRFFSEHQRL